MKKGVFFAVLCLCLGLASSALAHKPEGVVRTVFQWPAGLEPALDGDLSEWDIVPEDYFLTTKDHVETNLGKGNNFDESNLALRVAVGWSKGTNRLYFMMRRFDNLYDRNGVGGAAGGDDSWEIEVDADHGGESIWVGEDEVPDPTERELAQGRWAQTSHNRFPPLEPFGWKWFWVSKSTWHDKQPWADYGFRLDGQANSGEATAYVEIMSAAWDDFNFNGPDLSVLHEFKDNEIMGLAWGVIDHDSNAEDDSGHNGWWGITGDGDQWRTAAAASDFLLAPMDPRVQFPTAVEGNSWGRIKAVFVE
jgi:hypothetical protein